MFNKLYNYFKEINDNKIISEYKDKTLIEVKYTNKIVDIITNNKISIIEKTGSHPELKNMLRVLYGLRKELSHYSNTGTIRYIDNSIQRLEDNTFKWYELNFYGTGTIGSIKPIITLGISLVKLYSNQSVFYFNNSSTNIRYMKPNNIVEVKYNNLYLHSSTMEGVYEGIINKDLIKSIIIKRLSSDSDTNKMIYNNNIEEYTYLEEQKKNSNLLDELRRLESLDPLDKDLKINLNTAENNERIFKEIKALTLQIKGVGSMVGETRSSLLDNPF